LKVPFSFSTPKKSLFKFVAMERWSVLKRFKNNDSFSQVILHISNALHNNGVKGCPRSTNPVGKIAKKNSL